MASAGKEHFKRIRKLAIYFRDLKAIFNALDRLEIDLNQLNYFQEVEHLEIRVSFTFRLFRRVQFNSEL